MVTGFSLALRQGYTRLSGCGRGNGGWNGRHGIGNLTVAIGVRIYFMESDEVMREFDAKRRRDERAKRNMNLLCFAIVLGIVLGVIYGLVKFVKWAWYN
jgi:hypothetical protein